MIIISYGLPKSASTIIHTYTEELVLASGIKNGQKKLRAVFEEGFVYRFGIINTFLVIFIHRFYGSVVVKTHSSPDYFIRLLIKLKLAKAICSIRDPRDIALSAIDHGKKEGENPFKKFTSITNTLPSLINECIKAEKWIHFKNALFLRYENIIQSPGTELREIANYLDLKINTNAISSIVNKHEKDKKGSKNFNKGTTNRYLTEMTKEEISLCNTQLKQYIYLLGYSL